MPKGRGRGRRQQQPAGDGHANGSAAVGALAGPITPAASQAQAELQAPNLAHPAATEAAAEPHLGLGAARQPPRGRSRGGGSGGAGAALRREAHRATGGSGGTTSSGQPDGRSQADSNRVSGSSDPPLTEAASANSGASSYHSAGAATSPMPRLGWHHGTAGGHHGTAGRGYPSDHAPRSSDPPPTEQALAHKPSWSSYSSYESSDSRGREILRSYEQLQRSARPSGTATAAEAPGETLSSPRSDAEEPAAAAAAAAATVPLPAASHPFDRQAELAAGLQQLSLQSQTTNLGDREHGAA